MISETELKVWMGLTFYPIEDIKLLKVLRERLSLFMKAIQKTTTSEFGLSATEKKSIFDEVINAARLYNGDDQLSVEWHQYIRDTSNQTLGKEHDKIIASNLE